MHLAISYGSHKKEQTVISSEHFAFVENIQVMFRLIQCSIFGIDANQECSL